MKVNLGCGQDTKPGYLNVDFVKLEGVDLVCDVSKLPFRDRSIEELYASDILEHFPWRQVRDVLREWRRALRPGGRLKIRTPNLRGLVELYLQRGPGWRREEGPGVDPIVERIYGSQDREGNYHFVIFDEESITKLLGECNFELKSINPDGEDISNIWVEAINSSHVNIIWEAPVFDPSGYADEARNLILALDKKGVSIHLKPLITAPITVDLDPATKKRLIKLTENPFRLGVKTQEDNSIFIIHSTGDLAYRNPYASFNIARTVFETDRIPEKWVPRLNQMDEIWVPSHFDLETFSLSGVDRKKLKVIPQGIDVKSYNLDIVEPLDIPDKGKFNFLSVFDWHWRKGWDILLEAYLREFWGKEDVALILKLYRLATGYKDTAVGEYVQWLHSFIKERLKLNPAEAPKVIFLPQILSSTEMPRLYAACDAFIMTSHGEGWGRPYMEAMAMGLPTIGTRWSGNLEFMNDSNSYLIDCEIVEVPEQAWREVPLWRGHKWAQPSLEHTRELMRYVYEHREEAKAKGTKAREDISRHWTWDKVADGVIARLEEIKEVVWTRSWTQVGVPEDTGQGPEGSEVSAPALITLHPRRGVVWEGAFFNHHSLANINREVILELLKLNLDLGLLPCEPPQFDPSLHLRLKPLTELIGLKPYKVDIHVKHRWPPDFARPPEGKFVLIQPWEFGYLPVEWVREINEKVDEVWVHTEFVRDAYVNSGVDSEKVVIIPLGVDPDRFNPQAPLAKLNTDKCFKFLFVGGTINRKGVDLLLKAYCAEFTKDDDVCLVIKDFFYQSHFAYLIQVLKGVKGAPEILYHYGNIPFEQLPSLYTACDCYVHPYRGEGFGLPILEAMACGLPVVVTNFGACLDFCNLDNSYLIAAKVVHWPQKRVDQMETVDYPFWAEPDISELRRLMRHIFENRDEAKKKGLRASSEVLGRFTWKKTAEQMRERITALSSSWKAKGRPLAGSSPVFASILLLVDDGDVIHLLRCLNSLSEYTPDPHEIILVPKSSNTVKLDAESLKEKVKVLSGISWRNLVDGLIQAIEASKGEYVVLLHGDVVLTKGWLGGLIGCAQRDSRFVLVGPISNRAPQEQRIKAKYKGLRKELQEFASKIRHENRGEWYEVDHLGSFCLLIKRKAFKELESFNREISLEQAVGEFCARAIKAGKKLVCCREVYVHHFGLCQPGGGITETLGFSLTSLLKQAVEHEQQGDLEKALRLYEQADELWPDSVEVIYAVGSLLLQLGRVEEAVEKLQLVIKLDPDLASGHNNLGCAYFQLGKPSQAEEHFKRAIELNPSDLGARKNLGDLYFNQKRYNEAIPIFEQVLLEDPTDAESLVSLANCYFHLGAYESAAIGYRKALEIKPNCEDARANLEVVTRLLTEQGTVVSS